MPTGKKDFLITFNDFIDGGKCYFMLLNGQVFQGWISDIKENTFEYIDSGPMADEETVLVEIERIDLDSFAYWDDEVNQWTTYFVPDKISNRNKTQTK